MRLKLQASLLAPINWIEEIDEHIHDRIYTEILRHSMRPKEPAVPRGGNGIRLTLVLVFAWYLTR